MRAWLLWAVLLVLSHADPNQDWKVAEEELLSELFTSKALPVKGGRLRNVCLLMRHWLRPSQEGLQESVEERFTVWSLCRMLHPWEDAQRGLEYLDPLKRENRESLLKRKSPYILKRQFHSSKTRRPYILK